MVAIIDFIRTYTWDKQLETWVKSSGILGGAGAAAAHGFMHDVSCRLSVVHAILCVRQHAYLVRAATCMHMLQVWFCADLGLL